MLRVKFQIDPLDELSYPMVTIKKLVIILCTEADICQILKYAFGRGLMSIIVFYGFENGV